ncbi:TolC family protein [Candidatus Synechococcus calcipolaris G9]|uniref:TolC family protein n=1 Tax=Candidatus Synechococcus calcipolaris G9 TaxID=1497997 RepID=A0ABT6F2U8_9SYNE|nr:TolC family protein [Candidatus Synechococcus calcipolaris]MDG2992181.1 TolC family protein [Candidatus Synechococcus calcipolaris G9]
MASLTWLRQCALGLGVLTLPWAIAPELLAQSTPNPPSTASDLIPFNPNPDPLYLPTQPEQVEIDLDQPITLNQALELARRNNRSLQVTEQQLQQSRATLRQSQAALYPSISFQSSLGRSDSAAARLQNAQIQQNRRNQASMAGGAMQPTTLNFSSVSNTWNSNVQVGYNVFTSGQRPGSIRAAQEQVRNAELDLQRQWEQLRQDVTDDYYNIQQADALVRIGQAAVENSQISLRDAVARERAGLGTLFDVLTSEVQLANNQQQLVQSESQLQIARRQLAQTLSLNDRANLSAADPIQVVGDWTLSLNDSIALAFRNRVELEQQLTQRNVALQQRRVALGNLGPQLSVGGTFNTTDELTDSLAPQWGYSVSGQMNLTIFDGGVSRASAAQQEASAAIAETQFASFKNLIRFQVEQSYFTLKSSQENISTNQAAVNAATEGLRLARLRFQAGVGTQQEVSNAETSLIQAQSNLLSAVIDYNRAISALQRFVSGLPLNPEPASTAPTIGE